MSHSDTITNLFTKGVLLASTSDVKNAAYKIDGEITYAIQFHPEVYTTDGKKIVKKFLVDIANLNQDWTPDSFVEETILYLKEKLSNDKVVLGLSGGVDSTVCCYFIKQSHR